MKIRTIAVSAVAVGLLAACPMPVIVPDSVRAADCSTGPGARCDVAIRTGGRYVCDAGRFDVDPDYIRMRGTRPVNVMWTLPDNYAFCGADGVSINGALAAERRQVIESFGSDSEDGSRAPSAFIAANCAAKWHWNYSNEGTDTYKYTIRFTHKPSGRKCVIDPWIKNGNS